MSNLYKWPLLIASLIILAVLVYGVMSIQDERSTSQRVSDAVHNLPRGYDKAEQQLEDRTPIQKLGDDMRDHD